MRIRRVCAAVVLAAAVLTVSGVSHAAEPRATAAVSPKSVIAGTEGAAFTLTVRNSGTEAVDAIRIVRPAAQLALVGAEAEGWDTAEVTPEAVVLTGGPLLPLTEADVRVLADAGRPALDVLDAWRVEVSSDGGASFVAAAGASNTISSLFTVVQVLRTGRQVITPAAADDGTATAGQRVDVAVEVTNEGSGPLVLSNLEVSGLAAVWPGTANGPLSVAPGDSALATFTGVRLSSTPGSARLTVSVANADSTARQVTHRTLVLEEPVEIKPRGSDLLDKSFQCDRPSADPGMPLECSILVDKKAGGSTALLTTDTTLLLTDGDGPVYEPRLVSPVSFPRGTAERIRLRFERQTFPPDFNFGYYRPLIKLRGVDGNGAEINRDRYSQERILVNWPNP